MCWARGGALSIRGAQNPVIITLAAIPAWLTRSLRHQGIRVSSGSHTAYEKQSPELCQVCLLRFLGAAWRLRAQAVASTLPGTQSCSNACLLPVILCKSLNLPVPCLFHLQVGEISRVSGYCYCYYYLCTSYFSTLLLERDYSLKGSSFLRF